MADTPTLSDIAEQVGVSVMTVSRALADRPGVAIETKQRILDAARRLGYIQVASVRNGLHSSTNIIGVLVNNVGSEYIAEIIDGIGSTLDVASYDMVIYSPHRMRRAPDDYVLEVSQKQVDGLIIAAANILHDLDYLRQISQQQFPIVMIDQRVANEVVPFVTATNWQGAFDAMRYLIQLGHQRIGFISGAMNESPSSERLAGYRDALAQFGIAYDEALLRYGDFSRQSGYMHAQALLRLDPAPTAIFASNDPMAFGVMEAVKQHGKRVPEDVSVIGFDDIPSSAHAIPALTTVRQPLREMGRVGAQILLDMLRGNVRTPMMELRTSLILRDSCMPLR
jgi:LacI family transcriptional regulator